MSKKRSLLLFASVSALTLLFNARAFAQTTPQIILTPDKQSVKAGEELSIKVEVQTGEGNGTNSYIASLKYPEDKLTFESINTDKSAFDMALESKGGNGNVKIIKGSKKTLEGKLFAADVKFKAKADTATDIVKVKNDSAVIRSSDNTNILPGSTIQQPAREEMSKTEGYPMQDKLSSVWEIFEKIKNFFNSFFK